MELSGVTIYIYRGWYTWEVLYWRTGEIVYYYEEDIIWC